MQAHWPLTGRDDESSVIAELLGSATYRGVALTGRPGVGKSRLAREATARAKDEGWTVRQVAATATGRSVPLGAFGPWADEFEGTPLALARRVVDALTAGADANRLLVSVDDAHLLDELSALVLHQLVVQQSARIIVTIRSGQAAPDAVTALWKDMLVRRLELQPLSRSEQNELLTAALGQPPDADCADRMWRLTGGNALFLRQLVEQEDGAGRLVLERDSCRWLGDPQISPSLVDVVEQQIGAIPDAVREVVDLVAVAEPVDLACLATIVDHTALEDAEQRELIRTTGNEVYIGHPMYAEVRLNQCGPLRLRRLRGRVAGAMRDDAGLANAVRRGLLLLESDLAPNPQALAAAAAAASTLLDFNLAARLARAADESGVGVTARVGLAYNLLMSQQGDDAAAVIESIDTTQVDESAFINDVVLHAANLLWTKRSPQESWRVIDDALLTATGPRRGQLLAFRANQLILAARPAEVVEMMDTVDYGELDGYGQSVRLCAEVLGLAEVGRTRESLAKARACYQVLDSSEQGNFLSQALVEFHSFGLAVSGRIREACDLAETHRNDCAASPSTARAMAAAIVGAAALAAGDLPAALRELPAESAAEDADFVLVNSFYRFHLLRTQTLARLGDIEGAEAAMRTAEAERHPTYVLVELNALLAQGWLAAARGRVGEARLFVGRAVTFTREHGQLAREVLCLQTLVQFGDTSAATRLADLAAIVEGPRVRLALRYAEALDADDAVELERLSVEFEAMGDRLAAADVAAHAAAAHRRAGRTGSAMTAATRASGLAEACGGAVSPAISASKLAVPFTRREHEIVLLVAQGLSTKAIAEAVSLSIRTVEGHIYRASCKAGVAKRSELASMVQSLG